MTLVNWIGASGDWSTAADWSTGKVPGLQDDVVLPNSGNYTVTVSTAINVNSLALRSLSDNLDIEASGKTDVIQHDVRNAAYFFVDTSGQGGTTLNVGGTFTNNGEIAVGAQGTGIAASATITVAHLVNRGWIVLNGGADGSNAQASFIDSGDAAPGTLSRATLILNGDALLEFAGGKIKTIAGNAALTLDGDQAFLADANHTGSNSVLTDLTHNFGTITLADGARVTDTAGDFLNDGSIDLNGGSFALGAGLNLTNNGGLEIAANASSDGSVLRVTGTLYNTAALLIDGNGEAPTVVTAAHFDNNGLLDIEGSPSSPTQFNVTKDAAPDTLADGSTWNIEGDAVLTFASGKITSVATDATLTVSGAGARINDAGVAGPNSALDQLAENDGMITFSDGAQIPVLNAPFVNNGTFTLDGTSVLAGAGFTNTGTLNVSLLYGESDLPSGLVVTGTLNNAGTLNISSIGQDPPSGQTTSVVTDKFSGGTVTLLGSMPPDQATLAELIIKHEAAPTVLSAGDAFELDGDTLVQYASGSITAIARGAEISLDGTQARIADSADSATNSALTTLARNVGTLRLADGASLGNSNVAFTNSGLYELVQNTTASTSAGVDFTNKGTLTLDGIGFHGGSALNVGGTLTNTGTIAIGANRGIGSPDNLTASSEIIAARLLNTGTIDLFSSEGSANRAFLNDTADAAPATLQHQSLNLVGNARLEYSSGGIHAIARGAQITLDGSQALIAVAAKPSSSSALTGLTSNAGTLSLADDASIAKTIASFDNSGTLSLLNQETFHVSGDVRNSGTFIVDGGGRMDGDEGQSAVTVDGTLNNTGSVLFGSKTFALNGDTTIDVAHLVNTGTIDIASVDQLFFTPPQATLDDLQDNAPTTLKAGVISLTGNALLEYAGGSIEHIAKGAVMSLSGELARVANSTDTTTSSALTGLTSNAGTFTLSEGATASNGNNDFANSGTLNIDLSGYDTDTIFTIGGALHNSGTIVLSEPDEFGFAARLEAQSGTNSGVIDGMGFQTAINITHTFTNMGTMDLGSEDGAAAFFTAGSLIQESGEIEMQNLYMQIQAPAGVRVEGGVMEGSGEIFSNVTLSGGTFGQTGTGAFFVQGALTIDNGGTLETTLSADSNFIPFRVQGNVQLNGGTLELHAADSVTFQEGETFRLLVGSFSKLHGTFAQIEYGGVIATGDTIAIGNGLALQIEYSTKPNVEIDAVVIADPAAHQPANHASVGYTAVAPDGSVVHYGADDLILHHGALQHDGLALV